MNDRNETNVVTIGFEPVERHARLRLWLRLFGTVTMVEREIKRRLRAAFGMSLAKFDYLSQLYREEGGTLTMGQIGERLMVSGGNITGLTDRLEADGLVRRSGDPNDRRVQQTTLTPEGRALFARMAARHEDWVRELFAGLEDEDVEDLLAGLARLKTSVATATSRTPGRKGAE